MLGGHNMTYKDGKRPANRVTAVHISRDSGVTFQELAPLPFGDYYGDIFFINDTTLFWQPDDQQRPFYFLNLEANVWTKGLKLTENGIPGAMHRGNVGMVTRPSGEKEIVFVGGSMGHYQHDTAPADAKACKACNSNMPTKRVAIYNIATNTL